MIRRCSDEDFESICRIINDAAQAYEGVIPSESWADPYMPAEELRREIERGVVFRGFERDGELAGVIGLEEVGDVALIRHAYVLTAQQHRGIGGALLDDVRRQVSRPLLIGTWADASWAIRFYERRGFRLLSAEETDRLLRRYWDVPERQIESSVVLADERWFDARG